MGENIPVYRVNVLAALDFYGADAAHFLQGQLTINTEALAAGQWRWAAYCSRQGRVIAAGMLARVSEERFVFVVAADVAADVASMLTKYILRAKVKIKVLGGDVLFSLQMQAAAGDVALLSAGDVTVADDIATFSTAAGAVQFYCGEGEQPAAENHPQDNNAWLLAQIQLGIAWVTQAQKEEWIPQFLNYECINGIDFDKGCYVGQEVIARLQHLGEVKRRAVILHGSTPLASDSDKVVMAQSNESDSSSKAGMIINSASTSQADEWQALAVIKCSDLQSLQVSFTVGEQAVQWRAPAYDIPALQAKG